MFRLTPQTDLPMLAAAVLLLAATFTLVRRPAGDQPAADFIALIDRDGDDRVSAEEHARVTDGALAFAQLDLDGSGHLEAWEVERLLRYVTPLTQGHHSPWGRK